MKILLEVLRLVPLIIETIKALEAANPEPGNGKDKLDTILGIITDVAGDVSGLIPAVTAVVNRVVALFNKTGVFKKAA